MQIIKTWFLMTLIVFSTALSADVSLGAAEELAEAIALHDAGRNGDTQATADAIKVLEDIVKSEPENAEALAYLGSSYAIIARDSKKAVDKIRYTNRGLRFLDQAVDLEPENFAVRVIRANVASSLPRMFGRRGGAIEDGLMLDRMFSVEQSPKMARSMVDIYEMLGEIAEGQGDWANKANQAREVARR